MAILLSPIFESFSGRIGEFVFYRNRGKTCVRRCPMVSSKPRSAKQLQQQERVVAVSLFFKAIADAGLRDCWQKAAIKLSLGGHSLFFSRNIKAFTGDGLICDFGKITLSIGTLNLPDQIELHRQSGGVLQLEWKQNLLLGADRPTDRLQVALMKHEAVYTVTPVPVSEAYRQDEQAVIRIPPEWPDFTHLYCFFCSETGEYSVSRYFNLSVI